MDWFRFLLFRSPLYQGQGKPGGGYQVWSGNVTRLY